MIKIGARQNYKTTRLLRRLSTSNDHARHRATIDSVVSFNHRCATPIPHVVTGRPRSSPSSVVFQTGIYRTSATDRQHRNPHSF